MKKIAAPALILISFLAISCKQETNPVNNTQSKDYFPLTANSTWTYLVENSTPGDSLRIISDDQATFNGKLYNKFVYKLYDNDSLADSIYYRKSNSDYFWYFKENNIEMPFLKDNVPVNTTWSVEYTTGIFYKRKWEFLLKDKYQSLTIGNQVFNDVIRVSFRAMTSINSAPYTPVFEGDYYYAKNIGLIKWIDNDLVYPSTYTYNIIRHKVF